MRRDRSQRGAGTILVMGICLILATLAVGAAGLGRMVAVRGETQDLADSASLACARTIQRERNFDADCKPILDLIRGASGLDIADLGCEPDRTEVAWRVVCDATVAVDVPRFMALDGSTEVSARATAELPFMHMECLPPFELQFYTEEFVQTLPLPVGDFFVPLGEVRGWPAKSKDDDGGWQLEFERAGRNGVMKWQSDKTGTQDIIELRSCILGFTGTEPHYGYQREEVPPGGGAQRVQAGQPALTPHPDEVERVPIALVTGYWNGTDDDMSYSTDVVTETETSVDVSWTSGASAESSDALIVYCTRTGSFPDVSTIECVPDAPPDLDVVAERDIDEGLLQIVTGGLATRGVRVMVGGEPSPLPSYVEQAFETLQFQNADEPVIRDFFEGGEPEAQVYIDQLLAYAPNRYAVAELITLSLPADYLVQREAFELPNDNAFSWEAERREGIDEELSIAAIYTYYTSGNDRFQFYAYCSPRDASTMGCFAEAGAEPGGNETEVTGGAHIRGEMLHIQWSSHPKLVRGE